MQDLAARILKLFPDATFYPLGNVVLRDDGDGPFIYSWDLAVGEQPTEEQLLAVSLLPDAFQPLVAELALPAYAGLTDQEAADALNARDKRGLVPLWELTLALAEQPALLVAIKSNVAANPYAMAADFYINSPHVTNIDFDRESVIGMLAGLVFTEVITQEQSDSLSALADNRSTRCEQLGLPAATAAIVALARG